VSVAAKAESVDASPDSAEEAHAPTLDDSHALADGLGVRLRLRSAASFDGEQEREQWTDATKVVD